MEIIFIVLGLAAAGYVLWNAWPVNRSEAHGITLLCPIKSGVQEGQSYDSLIRRYLQKLPLNELSPFALIPNTYLCRAYVLNDVFYQGGVENLDEHLKSKYLVFTSNYHGDEDAYLEGMWQSAGVEIEKIWQHCVGFEDVKDAESFKQYVHECQVKTTFFFNGSNDDPLEKQLKALYLKQELGNFVFHNQGRSAEELQSAYEEFRDRTKPTESYPRWVAGSPHAEVTTGTR